MKIMERNIEEFEWPESAIVNSHFWLAIDITNYWNCLQFNIEHLWAMRWSFEFRNKNCFEFIAFFLLFGVLLVLKRLISGICFEREFQFILWNSASPQSFNYIEKKVRRREFHWNIKETWIIHIHTFIPKKI